jgi:hypothetical protein
LQSLACTWWGDMFTVLCNCYCVHSACGWQHDITLLVATGTSLAVIALLVMCVSEPSSSLVVTHRVACVLPLAAALVMLSLLSYGSSLCVTHSLLAPDAFHQLSRAVRVLYGGWRVLLSILKGVARQNHCKCRCGTTCYYTFAVVSTWMHEGC